MKRAVPVSSPRALKGFQDLLAKLPGLSADELKQVKARVDALLSLAGAADPAYDDDWLTAGLFSELERRGLLSSKAPRQRLLKSVATKAFYTKSAELRRLLTDRAGATLNTAELYALGRVAARALADSFYNTPVALKTLMMNIDKVPAALDAAYPGYLEAGLLRMVIRAKR